MNKRAILVAIAVMFFSVSAWAQGPILMPSGKLPSGQTGASFGGSYYNFSGQSGCDILVSIWGFVSNPGRYNIPCETNLLDLLSYCGGPRDGAFLDRIRIVRRGDVDHQNEIAKVFDVNAEKYLEISDTSIEARDMLLYPRDLIIVDGEDVSTVDYVLRVSQIIVAIASALTASIAIYQVTK